MALTPQAAQEALIRAGMINYANRGRGVLVISQGKMAYLTEAELPPGEGPFKDVRERVTTYNPQTEILIVADAPDDSGSKFVTMEIPESWRTQ